MNTPGPTSLLERLRANKGVSLLKAAELMSMSHKTLRRYERERVPYPQPSVLKRLADFYDVTADAILDDLRERAILEDELAA